MEIILAIAAAVAVLFIYWVLRVRKSAPCYIMKTEFIGGAFPEGISLTRYSDGQELNQSFFRFHVATTSPMKPLPEKVWIGFVYIDCHLSVKHINGGDVLTKVNEHIGTITAPLPLDPVAPLPTVREPLYYAWIVAADYENGETWDYPRAEYALKAYTNRLRFLLERLGHL